MTLSNEEITERVRAWLTGAVVGLNLCPFAAPVVESTRLRVEVARPLDLEGGFQVALSEIQRLIEAPSTELSTTLLVLATGFGSFSEFWELVGAVDEAIEVSGADGLIQTASFHPDYLFEGEDPEAISHYTNRAPFPILHLLRVDEVEAALVGYPDAECIPQDNIDTLEALGWERLRALWARWQV